jgi:GUN4-like/CHAT domain
MNDETPVKTILVLSANPKGTKQLRLPEEISQIKKGLERAKQRESFQIQSAEAVHPRDIRRSILDNNPYIVHFSGHGAGEPGLIFEDDIGQQKLVDAAALAGLFKLFADKIKCVLLNACYSEIQAKGIAEHIDYVIGMSQEIGDKAAIEFAVGFYDALGAGTDVEFAYKVACNAISTAGIQEHLTPQLLRKEDLHGQSINTTPVPTSPPQDARKATVVSPSPTLTPPTLLVSKQEEPENITKYRQKVEEFASDGVIDETESFILNSLQKKLGLTDDQAREVQEEVLEPYQIYKQQFTKKVAEQGYPLEEKAEAELKKLQNYYEIKDEYINLLKENANSLLSEKGVDYTKLRDLLAAGKWKDADQETLAVMLQATGRKKEGYLDYKSIENFPCTDLRTIDQLWVKYSNGQFGFSVQKRILWESVEQDYDKFGDRVGWRQMRTKQVHKWFGLKQETQHQPKWLIQDQLTYDTSAPKGHLPAAAFLMRYRLGVEWWVVLLFCRI